jgi:uncharacterized protein YuzE
MSTTFEALVPELVAPVVAALRSEGYVAQAESLASSLVERWTYDPSVKAGYVYLVQSKPIQHSETPAAKTLVFMFDHGFNVDLRAHGEVLGIELLEHESIFTRLAAVQRS